MQDQRFIPKSVDVKVHKIFIAKDVNENKME